MKNRVLLIGHLGGDPDIRSTDTGKKWARLSLATNESFQNARGEKVTETQWHNLVAWGKQAEYVEKYMSKGCEVAVDGKLVSRSYVDKEGLKKYITEIHINDSLLLGERKPANV